MPNFTSFLDDVNITNVIGFSTVVLRIAREGNLIEYIVLVSASVVCGCPSPEPNIVFTVKTMV